jgi:hypothetical protein
MVKELQERIATIEKAVSDVVANHRDLLVRLDEAKYLLDFFTKAAEAVSPASPVTEVLEAGQAIIENVSESQA